MTHHVERDRVLCANRSSWPLCFKNAIAEARLSDLPLFCYEGDGTRSLKKVLEEKTNAKACAVVVGCEGGFSIEEAEFAISEGMIPINLGPRILRCETAPTYALSCLSFAFELWQSIIIHKYFTIFLCNSQLFFKKLLKKHKKYCRI